MNIGVGLWRGIRSLSEDKDSERLHWAARQARLDVAETLAVSELSEGHRQILIPARQTSVVMIAIVAGHTLLELDVGQMNDQLRENGSAGIHPPLFRRWREPADSAYFGIFSSNRFLAERHLFHSLQVAWRNSQSTLPDSSEKASCRTA